MIAPVQPHMQRLFAALWPPAAISAQLAELTAMLHAEWGGRSISELNQHITIEFLGAVNAARVVDVAGALHAAAGAPFELQLDALEYRKHGGILWARATRVPESLQALARALRARLRALGFAVENRALLPHVTLLRDARRPARPAAMAPACWTADEITLVRSQLGRSGARYEVIARVPLAVRQSI